MRSTSCRILSCSSVAAFSSSLTSISSGVSSSVSVSSGYVTPVTASSGYSILVKIGSKRRKNRQATAPKTAAIMAMFIIWRIIFFLLRGRFLISSCRNPMSESCSFELGVPPVSVFCFISCRLSCLYSSRSGCSLLIVMSLLQFTFF